MLTQYQLSNQQNIEQQSGNLDSTLGKIESLQSIYQNNAALIDYLRDEYTDDRELIYFFLREISPAISFATLAEPSVQSLTIYPKSQKRLLTVTGFRPFHDIYNKLTRDEISGLRPSKGLWKKSVSGKEISLTYYQKIYNDTFTRELGIIELLVEPKLLGTSCKVFGTSIAIMRFSLWTSRGMRSILLSSRISRRVKSQI